MKQINFGQFEFKSIKELDLTIKIMIKESPRNTEFENKMFSELINSLHSDVIKSKLKVTKFKILDWDGQIDEWLYCRERFRGGIYVIGFFEPINKWHGVTLYPHKRKNKVKSKLILSLRQKWSEKAKKREVEDRCEQCGGDFPQLHHSNISFKEIANECLKCFTKEELENGLGEDWWLHENEADFLDDNHLAVKKLFELHKDVKYEWLCYKCHKERL